MEILTALMLSLASLATAPPAPVEVEGNHYQHQIRMNFDVQGPKLFQNVTAALVGINIRQFNGHPAFTIVDANRLPQPGQYQVDVAMSIIPTDSTPEQLFEVGVAWKVQFWCAHGDLHKITQSPLIQTIGTETQMLPRIGEVLKAGTEGIIAGVLSIDQQFYDNIMKHATAFEL